MNDTQRRYAPVIDHLLSFSRTRWVTLTIKSGWDLKERINFLRKSARKLSQRVLWKRSVLMGVRALEITFDPIAGWHAHFHIFCVGSYLKQAVLSKIWAECTGDGSSIVDIRAGYRGAAIKKELFKYTLKDAGIPAERIVEVKRALKGQRVIEFIGANKEQRKALRGLRLEKARFKCDDCKNDRFCLEDHILNFRFWTDGVVTVTGPPSRVVPVSTVQGVLFEQGALYGG